MNLSVIRSLRPNAKSPAKVMEFRAPAPIRCMKRSDTVSIFHSWMCDQKSIKLPAQTDITLKVKVPDNIGSVFYHLDLNELYSLDNFRGPAGGLKWTLFMNTANQLMEAPLMMPSLLQKMGRQTLGWKTIGLTWPSSLILDALIYAIKDTNIIDQYKGNKNQIKLAKKVGISNLGHMFSALSALGYSDELGYQQINLPITSVEALENELRTNLAQYKGNKNQVKLAKKVGISHLGSMFSALSALEYSNELQYHKIDLPFEIGDGFFEELIELKTKGVRSFTDIVLRLQNKTPEEARQEFDIILAENK